MKIITVEVIKELLKETCRTEKKFSEFMCGQTRSKKGYFLGDVERFFGIDLKDRAIDL